MINFDFDKYCYGCSTCKTICPTGAISMQYNQEGFLVPKIDLKLSLCIIEPLTNVKESKIA